MALSSSRVRNPGSSRMSHSRMRLVNSVSPVGRKRELRTAGQAACAREIRGRQFQGRSSWMRLMG